MYPDQQLVMAQIILCLKIFLDCGTCVYILALWHANSCKDLFFNEVSVFTQFSKHSDEHKKLIFLGSQAACLGYFRIYLTVDS